MRAMQLPQGCEIHKIDAYQGREADMVILATTRTSSDVYTNSDALRFLHPDERITVAPFKARRGLFIVADFRLPQRHLMWHR